MKIAIQLYKLERPTSRPQDFDIPEPGKILGPIVVLEKAPVGRQRSPSAGVGRDRSREDDPDRDAVSDEDYNVHGLRVGDWLTPGPTVTVRMLGEPRWRFMLRRIRIWLHNRRRRPIRIVAISKHTITLRRDDRKC